MKPGQFLVIVVLCWLVLWFAGGCIADKPATRNPPTTGDNLHDLLKEQLAEVKPMVARYLGLPENAILKYQPSTVNPLSLEVARHAGVGKDFVLSFLRPQKLPAGEYSWYGGAEFRVQRFGERQCEAECFYDTSRGHWLLDQICVAEPIIYEGKPAHYLRPIEPSPGWKPTDLP